MSSTYTATVKMEVTLDIKVNPEELLGSEDYEDDQIVCALEDALHEPFNYGIDFSDFSLRGSDEQVMWVDRVKVKKI